MLIKTQLLTLGSVRCVVDLPAALFTLCLSCLLTPVRLWSEGAVVCHCVGYFLAGLVWGLYPEDLPQFPHSRGSVAQAVLNGTVKRAPASLWPPAAKTTRHKTLPADAFSCFPYGLNVGNFRAQEF